jgi:dihydrofolate reductase
MNTIENINFVQKIILSMRKVILGVAISLDGFIEGPNGEYDWCFTDQDYGLSSLLKKVDTAFLGRKTYELTQEMNKEDDSGLPKLKQYVFSTTLEKVKEGETLIKSNIKTEVEKIKNEEGKDIWLFGGASLTSSLINLGLVDELSLAVHPILLGSGKPLFNNLKEKIKLTLVSAKTYSSGLISLTYKIE